MRNGFAQTVLATVIGGVLVYVITQRMKQPPATNQYEAGEIYA